MLAIQAKNKTSILSNVQQEILKLYATELLEDELCELKMQLARFYAQKAIQAADKIWDEKGYSAADMDKMVKLKK